MSSDEKSPEKARIYGNNLANDANLERKLKLAKEALKEGCKQFLEEFDEKLKAISEEDRQTDLLIETAISEVDKSFAEEKALFKEVERAADACVKADLNYIAKSKSFLVTNKKNKKRLGQLIEVLNSKQGEGPPSHKVRKM